MKKYLNKFMILFLTLGFIQTLPAQDNGLEDLLFSMTIKDLNALNTDQLDAIIENGDWLLLDGSLAALTLLSGKNEEYLLDAQLIQGEWKGLDEVLKYSCHLIFQGDGWINVVPDKTPRNPVEGQILLNSQVLVLAKLIGYELDGDKPVPYLLVSNIRRLL
ncbi:hypothetical protein EXM22_14260 [Oceanispirochaeta crateris]|uniref:Uncharacterized protein n=1 Tax=Oceanispirochaeta crateris TaxID=2518645 RepID=A0A5C1QLV0_9SPIO|nr:hypothetical protein [Oceanispirochaeta crateris]QEN09085.1 hypothetical protein EXM22_14260 [Oceanispirochaeta crateris]